MKEEIKDNRHQRIGYVDKELNGVITVYDKYNSRLGQIKPEGHKLQMATFFGRFCGAKRPRCVASGQIVFDL